MAVTTTFIDVVDAVLTTVAIVIVGSFFGCIS